MLFNDQEEANKYFEKMEEFVDKVNDKESAIKMLEMVDVCYQNQEDFFIPAIVISYEEMALLYVEDYKVIR